MCYDNSDESVSVEDYTNAFERRVNIILYRVLTLWEEIRNSSCGLKVVCDAPLILHFASRERT